MKKTFLIILIILIFIFVVIAVTRGHYKFDFTNNTNNNDINITDTDSEIVPINEPQDTIYFDKIDQKWKDEYGVCHTCNFENGFNPHGWLLSDAEELFVSKVIDAEQKHNIDLTWNKITSQEQLDQLIEEAIAEGFTSPQ